MFDWLVPGVHPIGYAAHARDTCVCIQYVWCFISSVQGESLLSLMSVTTLRPGKLMCMIPTLSGLFHAVSVSTPYLNYHSSDTVFAERKFIAKFGSFPPIMAVVFVRTIVYAQKCG